jgi:hypothetical protein
MKKSINKFLKITKDMIVYPGHGEKTTINNEKRNLTRWLKHL